MSECPLTKNMLKYLELVSSQAWWPLKGKDEPIGIECLNAPRNLRVVTGATKTDMDSGQAVKHDQGKSRMDLIPPEAIEGIAEVLTFGANKYAARNWEQGSDWGRFTAALLRHFTAWMSGEDYDPETGLSHLKHVLCNAAFLLTFQERGIGYDDRETAE